MTHQYDRTRAGFACRLMIVCFLLPFTLGSAALAQQVAINEVMASNGSTIADEDGDYADWIELFNYGAVPAHLEGFGLSDDYENPFRWLLPDTILAPGDFLLVWASGKDRTTGGVLHTNFRLLADGEEVTLTTPEGTRIDELAPTSIPRDHSLGRYPDGTGDWMLFTAPTPGAPNSSDGYLGVLDDPEFSHPAGFYEQGFNLRITTSHPGATIYYTLDGGVPDSNSLVHDGPISIRNRTSDANDISMIDTAPGWQAPSGQVFKATVVRAVAMAQGYLPGRAVAHTFFVHPQIHSRYDLPVFSISTDRHGFFDYDDGIYVPGRIYDEDPANPGRPGWQRTGNYTQRGPEWERPIHMEFFETDGTRAFSIGAGARIHGGATRSEPLKSLRIYFRSIYDEQNYLEYPIFPRQDRANYKRLILRNSGNDFGFTYFRDGMMQALVRHIGFETQEFRPAVVFLNGEYWGIHNIRERFDDRYIENVYGVDRDQMDMLELGGSAVYGNNQHYQALLSYIRNPANDITGPRHYQHVKEQMDVENFAAYQLSQIYFGNTDWPGNNIRFWRKRTDGYQPGAPDGHDGRWRWLMYDVDFGFNLYGDAPSTHNTLAFALATNGPGWPNPPWSTELLRTLVRNPDFRAMFVNMFADHLNTSFRPERVEEMIDRKENMIAHAIPEHRTRWNRLWNWDIQVNRLHSFARNRPARQRQHLDSRFNLGGTGTLTVDVSDPVLGRVKVNSIVIDEETVGLPDPSKPYPWTGTYFNDLPVQLVALPAPGVRLSKWDGIEEAGSDTVLVSISEAPHVTAVFERYVDPVPAPAELSAEPYSFTVWAPDEPAGSYPLNMEFRQSRVVDPTLEDDMDDAYTLGYDLDQRTRIVGLADGGFAFINTGTPHDVEDGAEGRDLGAAVLGLNTTGCNGVSVLWSGTTVIPNEREYAIRLQYRIGDYGPFREVLDENGRVMEYLRSPFQGHRESLGPVTLVEGVDDRSYVQLRWVYYHTGVGDSGPRDMLGVGDINVTCTPAAVPSEDVVPVITRVELHQNYPNPFNPATQIRFELPEAMNVTLRVFNTLGQEISTLADGHASAGSHSVEWEAAGIPSGVYFYQLETPHSRKRRTMVLVR